MVFLQHNIGNAVTKVLITVHDFHYVHFQRQTNLLKINIKTDVLICEERAKPTPLTLRLCRIMCVSERQTTILLKKCVCVMWNNKMNLTLMEFSKGQC